MKRIDRFLLAFGSGVFAGLMAWVLLGGSPWLMGVAGVTLAALWLASAR